jgi:ATP-binding cassette subfamily B protein
MLKQKFNTTFKFFKNQFEVVVLWIKMAPVISNLYLFASIVSNFSGVINSFFVALLIDNTIKLIQESSTDFSIIQTNLIWFFVYNFFNAFFSERVLEWCKMNIDEIGNWGVERRYFLKVNEISNAERADPEIASKFTVAYQYLWDLKYMFLQASNFYSSALLALYTGFILFNNFPIPVLLVLILGFIKLYPTYLFNKKIVDFDSTVYDLKIRALNMHNYLVDSATDKTSFKISSLLKYFEKIGNDIQNRCIKTVIKIRTSDEVIGFAFSMLVSIIEVYLYWQLFGQAISGTITLGTLIFLISVTTSFISNSNQAMVSVGSNLEGFLKVSAVLEVFNMKSKEKDGDLHYYLHNSNPPAIEFKNVSFSYPRSEKKVFSNLNLVIRSGEKIAIVGENGAGKSTLIKLIARSYRPSSGQILVDGQDLNSLKQSSWYENIGILFQEFDLYGYFTVKENIYFGDISKPLDEKKIIEASINADAHDFISEYTKGYDSLLDETYEGGVNPSGGQKQKIAIARFFYRNAPLAIFDEPTSAIDAVSEYRIFNKIYEFFKNKTVIIVSHKFSTVRNADRIIVVDEGSIIEEGTHDELMSLDGKYAQAFRLQAQGYN